MMGARRMAAYGAVAVAAALAAGCWESAPSPDDGSAKSEANAVKPGAVHEILFQFEAFTSAPLVGGGEVTVASLRGRVVLLDIFGTWCGPCHKSTPLMVSLYERFRAKGLAMVGLAKELTDDAAQAGESVKSFREEFKIPYRLALCPDTIWDDLTRKAEVDQVVPTVLLVDRHGVVRYLMQGYDPGEEAPLADAIEKLLAEPMGPVPPAEKPSPAITRNGGSVPNVPYYAYWLSSKELGAYVNLILSRQPIADLVGVSLSTNQAVLDCEAVITTTYAKDSLWNTDRRPIKPLATVEHVKGDQVTIGGQTFKWEKAEVEHVARLLRTPEGGIPIHRIYSAAAGQEEEIKTFAARFREQINGK